MSDHDNENIDDMLLDQYSNTSHSDSDSFEEMLFSELQNENALEMHHCPSPPPFSPILIEPANEDSTSAWYNDNLKANEISDNNDETLVSFQPNHARSPGKYSKTSLSNFDGCKDIMLSELQNENTLQLQDNNQSYHSPSPPPFSPISIGSVNEDSTSTWDNDSLTLSAYETSDKNDGNLVSSQPNPVCDETSQSQHCIAQLTQSEQITPVFSYKLVGDNIDKDIKPRNMRIDHRTKSLHYFNAYAIKDRIDTSHLVESHNSSPQLCLNDILPTNQDYSTLKSNFTVLVSRILCQNFEFFRIHFSDVLISHIPHRYSKEMSEISEMVRTSIATVFANCFLQCCSLDSFRS